MMLTSNTRKKALTAMILFALTIALIPVFTPNVNLNAAPADTTLEFRPGSNNYLANETAPGFIFIVNATVMNVTDLQNWQITVTWNASVLDFVNITLPSDNVFGGSGKSIITPPVVNTSGYVQWGATYINEPYWTFNGTGTLCQIAFMIRVPTGAPPWTSDLTFANIGTDTFLLRADQLDILFDAVDGTFAYKDFLTVTLSPLGLYFANYSESVAFMATAINGSLPYSYRWYFKYPNGTEIEATEAAGLASWGSYPITEFGDYRITVNVTDSVGVQVNASTIVRLKVLSVVLSPGGGKVNVNDMRTFTATVSGGIPFSGGLPPYKIQWDRNGTEINAENQTTVSLAFTTVGTETVRVNVTDSQPENVTASAQFIVLQTPTTILQVDSKIFYTNATLFDGDETLTFNVTVQGVTDLQNWQAHIRWNPTLLGYVSITLPSDNVFAGADRALITPPPLLDVDGGGVTWGATYINDPYWTFNGTGTLCQLQLQLLVQPLAQTVSPVSIVSQYADTFALDGLGVDIPYNIVNGTFSYALVSPVTHNVFGNTVLTYTNASILANNVTVITDTKSITFMVNGPAGTGGWVNVTIPKSVMNGTHSIFVNAVNVTATGSITSDAINWYVYIEFSFSSATTIRIQGTQVVPEQMPLLIVALLIASLIAVVFAKVPPKKKWMKY